PGGKHRITGSEDRFVEERDYGEGGQLNVVHVIAFLHRLLRCRAERIPHVLAKTVGAGYGLAVETNADNRGKDFLKAERQVRSSLYRFCRHAASPMLEPEPARRSLSLQDNLQFELDRR